MFDVLEIKGLCVETCRKRILENVNMKIEDGKIKALIGPNGTGKTSLVYAISGRPKYKTVSGSIMFNGIDITQKSPDERAKMGIFLMFQNPPEIEGVKLKDVISAVTGKTVEETRKIMPQLNLKPELLDRYFNKGFSGGEKKKVEMLIALLMKPKLALLDEPDSGVDADSIRLIAEKINEMKGNGTSFLIISHQAKLLDMLSVDGVFVMENKGIGPQEPYGIVKKVEERGYESIRK